MNISEAGAVRYYTVKLTPKKLVYQEVKFVHFGYQVNLPL